MTAWNFLISQSQNRPDKQNYMSQYWIQWPKIHLEIELLSMFSKKNLICFWLVDCSNFKRFALKKYRKHNRRRSAAFSSTTFLFACFSSHDIIDYIIYTATFQMRTTSCTKISFSFILLSYSTDAPKKKKRFAISNDELDPIAANTD